MTGLVKVVSSAPAAPVAGPALITYGVRFTCVLLTGNVTRPVHCPLPVEFRITSDPPILTATSKSSVCGLRSSVFSKRTVPETET